MDVGEIVNVSSKVCVSGWDRMNNGKTAAFVGQCKQCWNKSDCEGKGYNDVKCDGYQCYGKVTKTKENCPVCINYITGCDSEGRVWTPLVNMLKNIMEEKK